MAVLHDFASRLWLSSYSPGVPADVPPAFESLADMMTASATTYARSVALDFFGATTTYQQLADQISRAARGLRELGVRRGDRVALVMPNCPQHVVAFHAIMRLGAIAVEHNPLYTPTELETQFRDHGARVAIVWDKLAATVLGLPADLGTIAVVAVDLTTAFPRIQRLALATPIPAMRARRAELTAGRVPNTTSWRTLLASPWGAEAAAAVRPDDVAVLQYTSGTTGTPRAAILTHANLRINASQGEAWLTGLTKGREVFYAVLPMFHAYGLTLCLTFAMSVGARLVLFPRFDENLVLAAMRRVPATFLPAVPPIYERLMTVAHDRRVSLSGIRYGISGAMPLATSTVENWEQETGGVLVEGYGMTEASPIIACNPAGPTRRPGTVGLPFPNTQIRVVDPENPTTEREPGAEGELLVRGPQVFRGYWNRDEETRAVLLADGWLRTGDIVRVSEDGFITIVDRIKELINTGGFKVAPSEIEAVLLESPGVLEAAVVGLRNVSGSEDVAAAVVLEEGIALDVEAMKAACRKVLTAYKVPRSITRLDALPHSIVGKVERRKVRELLEQRNR